MQRLEHRNIVKVFDVQDEENEPKGVNIFMELCEPGSFLDNMHLFTSRWP